MVRYRREEHSQTGAEMNTHTRTNYKVSHQEYKCTYIRPRSMDLLFADPKQDSLCVQSLPCVPLFLRGLKKRHSLPLYGSCNTYIPYSTGQDNNFFKTIFHSLYYIYQLYSKREHHRRNQHLLLHRYSYNYFPNLK